MPDKKQMWMDFLNTNEEDDEPLERQQGIKQGIAQGKQDLISKMKKLGISDEQIQKILAIK